MNYLGYTPLSVPSSAFDDLMRKVDALKLSVSLCEVKVSVGFDTATGGNIVQSVPVRKKEVAYNPKAIVLPLSYHELSHRIKMEAPTLNYAETISIVAYKHISYNPKSISFVSQCKDMVHEVLFRPDGIKYKTSTCDIIYIPVYRDPSFERYTETINSPIRRPCYKIELLR